MSLSLFPQPSLFDPNIDEIRDNTVVPKSAFYVRRPFYVPWSAEDTAFILETSEPSDLHEIIINRTDTITTVPGSGQSTLQISLSKGANRIEVNTPTQTLVINVAATAVESWLNTLGREFYLATGQRIADVQANLISPWSTRLSAHLIPYNSIFLPSRMPKIHQTRLAVLSSMGRRLGFGDGVINVARATTYTTPPVTKTVDAEFVVPGQWDEYPNVTTHPTTGEMRGKVLDLWTANTCLAAHNALVKLTQSIGSDDAPLPKPLELLDKTDRQLILRSGGGDREVHFLDPLSPECSDLDGSTSCDANVRTWAKAKSIIQILMMTPQLEFDMVVENPLLFGFFDEGGFWDSYTGHGDPGIGGGDDTLDTVDLDDPFGSGFLGVSLSRRLDFACLDTREQLGRRLTMATAPITTSSPPALTLEPPIVEGNLIKVDGAAGAPAPNLGVARIWIKSNRRYFYEGDHIRFEAPDQEVQVVSAWPVLDDPATQIIKSDATVTFAAVGLQKILTAPVGFFEARHESMGVETDGTDLFTIVSVNADGSQATIVGNPAVPAAGPFIANVYLPLYDRSDESEADASTLQNVAGVITYDVTMSAGLVATLPDGELASYRVAPRIVGATGAGVDTLVIMSDTIPIPTDGIYFDSVTPVAILSSIPTGNTHAVTGLPEYTIILDGITPAAYSDDDALFVLRADPCWPNGDPVTPLMLIKLDSGVFLVL